MDITGATDPHLQEAIEDAHYLLAYFSRTRVEIPPEKRLEFDKSVRILSSARAIGSRPFKPPAGSAPRRARKAPDAEAAAGAAADAATAEQGVVAAFWKAFIQLSDLAYPATIESIRYYFRYYNLHFPATHSQTPEKAGKIKLRTAIPFYLNHLSFTLLTIIALFMSVGLSLLSYIGTKALAAYTQDYLNWSQVQTLSESFDEKAKVYLDDTTLEIAFNSADSMPMLKQKDQPQKALPINDSSTKSDLPPDIKLDVKAQVERVKAILAAADPSAPAVDFRFACKPLVAMFAEAQGKNLPPDNQPVLPGGVSVEECINQLFNAVPARVIAIADDLVLRLKQMIYHYPDRHRNLLRLGFDRLNHLIGSEH